MLPLTEELPLLCHEGSQDRAGSTVPLGSKPGTLNRGASVLPALVALLSLTERARRTARRITPPQFQFKN